MQKKQTLANFIGNLLWYFTYIYWNINFFINIRYEFCSLISHACWCIRSVL